jgi:hypothetical protein
LRKGRAQKKRTSAGSGREEGEEDASGGDGERVARP